MIFSLLFLFSIKCWGDSVAEVQTGPMKPSASLNLPLCVNDSEKLKEIEASVKANKKSSSHKYRSYKEALSTVGDREMMARLVYAESLGSNCPEKYAEISQRIAAVIGNRIKKRNGNILSVVFEKDQFASSLNHYKESHWRDFLCPLNEDLWLKSQNAVSAVLDAQATAGLSSQTVNYFLFKHSPRWPDPPDWATDEDVANASKSLRDCLRTYKIKGWD